MLARLKRRLPDAADETLLSDLLDEAGAFLRAYTFRREVPEALEPAQIQVAAILYNRLGMEGESSHGEGGVTRTAALLPEDLKRWLNGWRVARTLDAAKGGAGDALP